MRAPQLSVIVLLFISLQTLSQVGGRATDVSPNQQTLQGWSNRYLQDPYLKRLIGIANEMPSPKGIKGSPYANEKFTNGSIYLENEKLGEEFLRYNAYSDEMEISYQEEYLSIIKFEKQKIIIEDKTYLCLRDDEGKLSYFINYGTNEDLLLLERFKVIYKNGVRAKTSLEREIPPSFKSIYKYFIYDVKQKKLFEINTQNKKKFYQSLSQISPELSNKAKKMQIKGNNLQEIVDLMASI